MKGSIIRITLFTAILTFLIHAALMSVMAAEADKVIRAGFCPGPCASMFYAAVKPGLEAKGYRVEFKEYPGYVQPNIALVNGDIDLNMFQRLAYLENFKKQRNLDLAAAAFIPTISMGIYSNTVRSLDETPGGAAVAVVNGNFAIFAGLDISRVLYSEKLAPDLINVIAIRNSSKGSQMEKDLLDVLSSQEYKKITEDPKRMYSSLEQSATSEEINRALDEENRIAGETAHGMVQSSSEVQVLSQTAQNLKKFMEGLSG